MPLHQIFYSLLLTLEQVNEATQAGIVDVYLLN